MNEDQNVVIDSLNTLKSDNIEWELLSQQNKKLENKRIVKSSTDKTKVYCYESYAQEAYDLYTDEKHKLVKPVVGSHVKAKVIHKFNDYVALDIGWRDSAYIDLSKEI